MKAKLVIYDYDTGETIEEVVLDHAYLAFNESPPVFVVSLPPVKDDSGRLRGRLVELSPSELLDELKRAYQ